MKHVKFTSIIFFVVMFLMSALTAGYAIATNGGPGLYEVPLVDKALIEFGTVRVWNSPKKLHIQIVAPDGLMINEAQLFAGTDISELPVDKNGKPKQGEFPWKFEADKKDQPKVHTFVVDLKEDLDFSWGPSDRTRIFALHAELSSKNDEIGVWAKGATPIYNDGKAWMVDYLLAHPMQGQFIDAPVQGLSYLGPTQQGVTGFDEDGELLEQGGFSFFPGENILFSINSVELGVAPADKKVSPLDLFIGSDTDDPRVIGVARLLQSLDEDAGAIQQDGKIQILPEVAACFAGVVDGKGLIAVDYGDTELIDDLLAATVAGCNGAGGAEIAVVSAADAQGNLLTGLSQSGIFRKNISKTEDLAETKQKLEVMPVYLPGLRSDGSPSICCIDETPDDGVDDCDPKLCDDPETPDVVELCPGEPGVPYEEWRLGGDPTAEECDPRDDSNENGIPDGDEVGICLVTLIECRVVAKPLVVSYLGKVDIYDDQVKTEFWPGRFSYDMFTAVSRDDGTTWKRMNVSRMADLSSFDLETEEPFPGTAGQPYLKVNDNYILNVWESKYCKSGNPRYSITTCDDPATEEEETYDPIAANVACIGPGDPDECCTGAGTGICNNTCAEYLRGNEDQDTDVLEPDYPYDDAYAVTDIWGVRGQQQSVDYNEVDDVADLGIGEIPYSCLWAARGVIVTQKELNAGTFDSLNVADDETTPDVDETQEIALGDIVWFKSERLTSGRRDVYVPMLGSARGAGFAIAWQEDPSGLRPGKGKGPGEGWSGAVSNHKTDIWYSYISYDDFANVDANFVPGSTDDSSGGDPSGDGNQDEKPGLGRPKAQVPFSLPVRISDNDMVNTHTLKVEPSESCVTPPNGTEEVCFPEVVDGSFVPLDPEEIAVQFCDHANSDPATCCDPENQQSDPNCEDLKGLYGNLTGTKRYAYLARNIDEIDNTTGLAVAGGDGIADFKYYVDRGGTLDLCDTTVTGSENGSYMDVLPGTSAHERWYGFTNVAEASKLVCVTSDGRILDGDVSASRPMLQLQPYTKEDGTKSAWVLLAYEESKGMGHSLDAGGHGETDNPVDDIIGDQTDDKGQIKPIKQDLGKNVIYHSFDFTQPDLVDPGHIVNLPALCGGLYPTYCDDRKTPDYDETQDHLNNPTCTCEPGQPVPLYFDYEDCTTSEDGTETCEWLPDPDLGLLQYRTEIARRVRFLMQSPGKMDDTKTLGAIIFKQGQEGQGRPADVFIRRMVKSGTGNPYKFENFECTRYLDQTFTDIPGCPTDGVQGYMCNVWGEAYGDRLCGGINEDGDYPRRDHINLTSANVDLAVGTGPEDDTPDDPTDDVYNRNKVLLWHQTAANLGDESYGLVKEDGTACDVLNGEICPGMYSNARSHRGFIRGDFFVTAYAWSPNWAAGRNGNDRYNFYVRRSFDGGQTWTTDPAGDGVYVCPEFRTDPDSPDPDGSGNLPPAVFDQTCGTYDPEAVPDGELPPQPVGIAMTNYLGTMGSTPDGVPAQHIGAGMFEPARNISEIKSNKESSGDPRLGTTPPTYPLDGTLGTMVNLCPKMGPAGTWECIFPEDEYVDNMYFVAWGTVDNAKSTGSSGVKAESSPLDIYYTRTEDYGDNYLKLPWEIGGENSNQGFGETVWRYDFLAKGEPEEQGECQLRATSDGSKMYAIYHSMISEEADPDEEYTRWYPWKPEFSYENDLWFRRVIFYPTN